MGIDTFPVNCQMKIVAYHFTIKGKRVCVHPAGAFLVYLPELLMKAVRVILNGIPVHGCIRRNNSLRNDH